MKRIAITIATLLILIVLGISLFFYDSPKTSLNWDGGIWSEPQTLPFASSETIQFKDNLLMFYTKITKDTMNMDDAIEPDEYQLWDVFYRVYDGSNYSEEIPLTNSTDEIRVQADFLIYNDNLYAILREEWINNFTSYDWTTRVRMQFFDGTQWHNIVGPYVEDELLFGAPQYCVYNNEIWAIRKNQEPNVFMPNSYSYKTFDGISWSTPQNFSFPTCEPHNWKFMILNNQLWSVWENVTVQTYQSPYYREANMYLGCFDGENWTNVTMMSLPETIGSSNWPCAVVYNGELLIFWSNTNVDETDLILKRFNLNNFSLNELAKDSSGSKYKINFNVETCTYNDRLYMLVGGLIWNFNGTSLSESYRFPDQIYGRLFVFKDKLWTVISNSDVEKTFIRNYVRTD
ncbi:MAG: hypothetical protein ACM3WQ_03380 [Chloroflexota bacterium]